MVSKTNQHYDVIVVGTGFASSFFLAEYLEKHPKHRILVLEMGNLHSHEWQVKERRNSPIDSHSMFIKQGHTNKDWYFNVGFGGGSNCWTACTPRMLPSDFEMKTRYNVGTNWPISYSELEEYYCKAEYIMNVSGPEDWELSHRSRPFPQPPHNFCDPDRILKKAYPSTYFQQATSRPRIPTKNRPSCCATGTCNLCPINAKFSILNELGHLFFNTKNVSLSLNSKVTRVLTESNIVKGVEYELLENNSDHSKTKYITAYSDLVILGANAIFNPAILLNSGFSDPLLGKNLHEQLSTTVSLDLDGIDNYQGSTVIPGQGYMFYDGEHRHKYGACLTENINKLNLLRREFGRWRQKMTMVFIVEDLPLVKNQVSVDEHGIPIVEFESYSDYGLEGLKKVPDYIDELSNVLPIEKVYYEPIFEEKGLPRPTEWHIQGTVVMGDTPKTSVIDKHSIHHKYRNLLILGSSSFPTGAPVNPTLTICALSLMSARYL